MVPFSIPNHADTLKNEGQAQFEALPCFLKLLVWNLYKGQGHKAGPDQFQVDWLELSKKHDLSLWQEMIWDEKWRRSVQNNFWDSRFHFASSFQYQNQSHTGVGILSCSQENRCDYIRGSERELFFLTPKVSLWSRFKQYDSQQNLQETLVINTHVVNFTTTASFIRFLDELLALVSDHHGPLILAGDFNTWNFKRWHSLIQKLARLNVFPVEFEHDPRVLRLDHVFLRGYEVKKAEILSQVYSSDHFPLTLQLQLLS